VESHENGVTFLDKKMKDVKELIKQNKYDEAVAIFMKLIENHPSNPLHYINFANLLVELKQFEHAFEFYKKAIQEDNQVGTAYYGIGNIHYKQGNYDSALKMYQKAVDLGVDDSDVYYMIGLTFVQQNQVRLAIPYLQRAAELDRSVAKLFQYGLVMAQTNYIQEAEHILKQVIDKDPKHPDALYNLGMIELHNNERENAKKLFEKTLSIQADHLLAIKALRTLENVNNE